MRYCPALAGFHKWGLNPKIRRENSRNVGRFPSAFSFPVHRQPCRRGKRPLKCRQQSGRSGKRTMTFEQVFTIFKDYMEQDKELEVVKTKKGYLRIIWSGGLPYCEDGYLCRTPEELFDRFLSDCQSFHENRLTKGCRELTPEDTKKAEEFCRPYLEKWKEIIK